MSIVSSRYARAFADVVFRAKMDAAGAVQEIEQLVELVGTGDELRPVMDSPSVPQPQKLKLLDELAARAGFSRSVRNFAAILIEKRRLGLLPEIAGLIKAEINERMGLADAEIVSARELGPEERSLLETELARVTGKTIRARYSLDSKALGGAMIRMGSTIYDGSVRGRLQRMKTALAG